MSSSKRHPWRVLAVAATVAAGLSGSVAAQEPEGQPAGPDTIYIPYKDLEKVFETEGQGVFLPYKEFLKLWKASRPPGLAPSTPPPVAAAITGAEYTGQVTDKVARITARYDVRVLAEGWTELPLNFGALALSNVQIDGPNGALLTTAKRGHKLLAPAPGNYRLTLELAARVSEKPGIRSLKLTVPAAPRARLDLTLPGTDLGVTLKPNLAATIGAGPVADTTRVLAFLGPARTLDVEWRPRTRVGPDRQPMLMARTETAVSIEEGAIQARATVNYTILQAPAERFVLRVPRDYTVLSLTGANLRSWDTADDQGTRVITVTLHSPVEDRYAITLHLERMVRDVTGDVVVPQIVADNTERERGTLAVGVPSNLAVSVGPRQGLTQKDPSRTPRHLRGLLPDGSADLLFDYLGGTRALTVRVSKVTARVRAVVAARYDMGETRHTLTGRIALTIERAGIFSVNVIVPKGFEPLSVQPENAVDDWRIADHADGRQLTIDLKKQTQGALHLALTLQRVATAATGAVSLPSFRVEGAEKETGFLGVAVQPGFKVSTTKDSLRGYLPADLVKLQRAGVRYDANLKLGFSYTRHPLAGTVEVERLTAQVSGRTYTTVDVKEGVLAITYQVHYTVQHAGVKQLRFSVPEALSKLSDAITGANVKQISKPEKLSGDGPARVAYTIDLQGDVMGAYVLTVKHEQKLELEGPGKPKTVTVPRLDLLDVFSQEEHVAVTKADNVVLTPTPTGYRYMDARELEGPMRARQSDVVMALRYAGDPDKRSLSLEVTKYKFAETVRTTVNHMHVDVVFAGARALKAMAYLEVQNVQRQFLTVRVPTGAKIHQVTVMGVERRPSLAGGPDEAATKDLYLIDLSLPPGGGGATRGAPFVVTIRYDMSMAQGLAIPLPQIVPPRSDDPIPVALQTLRLWLPSEEYQYTGFSTNMRRTFRRAGIWSAVSDWIGWDRAPRAEWGSARRAIAALLRKAGRSGGSLIVTLPLPKSGAKAFLRHDGGGYVNVSYMGRTGAQALKVIVFLVTACVALYLAWAQGLSRIGTAAVPAGAALLVSALSESLTPFASAVLLGALAAGLCSIVWVFYTEIVPAWTDRNDRFRPPPPPQQGPPDKTDGGGHAAGLGPDASATEEKPASGALAKKAAKKAPAKKKAAKKPGRSSKKPGGSGD